MSWLTEARDLDRRVWYLAIARMISTAGFALVMPFLAIHLAVERGVSAVTVGLIWLVAGALSAVGQWAAGELADRVGRRRVMLTSMLLRTLNLFGLGLAVGRPDTSIFIIGALCVGNGVLRAFFDPVAAALVADLAPAERRVAAFSLQRVGINLGWAAGPAVHSLAAGVPYATLFLASVPVTLIATLLVVRLHDVPGATSSRKTNLRELLAFLEDRALVRFLLATLAFYLLQVQLYQTMSIYAARTLHLSRSDVGLLYTLNGLLVVFLQMPAVHHIQRLGTRRALILGCVGYALAYGSVALAVGHVSLLLCIAAVTLAEIVTAPAQQTTVTGLAPAGRIGAYTGLFGLTQVVSQSIGPVIGAVALEHLPGPTAWPTLALFGLVAALGYRRVTSLTSLGHTPGGPRGADGGAKGGASPPGAPPGTFPPHEASAGANKVLAPGPES